MVFVNIENSLAGIDINEVNLFRAFRGKSAVPRIFHKMYSSKDLFSVNYSEFVLKNRIDESVFQAIQGIMTFPEKINSSVSGPLQIPHNFVWWWKFGKNLVIHPPNRKGGIFCLRKGMT